MRFLICLLLPFTIASSALSQSRLELRAGTMSNRGDARADSDPERPELHADRPTTIVLALSQRAGAWHLALNARRTTADLTIRGTSTAIVTRDALSAWGMGLEASRRLTGGDGRPELRFVAGALFERWTFSEVDEEPRWRAALTGAFEAGIPLSNHWIGTIRAEVAGGPSLFKPGELPEGYVTRIGWRYGVAFGSAYAW